MASKVTIICREPGMRRNGITNPAKAVYDADRWTAQELSAFRADPNFEVIDGEVEDNATLGSEKAKVTKLQAQIAELSKSVSDLTAERDNLASEKAALQDQLDQAKAAGADAAKALETVTAERDQLKADAAAKTDKK